MTLAAQWYHPILATIFALVAVLLMLVILLQRGRGMGLSGAFGGGGGGHTTFGSKTGDFLTWITIAGAALFLICSIVLNFMFVPTAPNLAPTAQAPTPPGRSAPAPGAQAPARPIAPAQQGPAVPPSPPVSQAPAAPAAPSAPPAETPPPVAPEGGQGG